MDFLHALSGVFSLLVICLLGICMDRWGWIGAETRRLVPRLVTTISLPAYLFHSIATTFSHEDVGHFLSGSFIPIISILLTFGAALLTGRLCRVQAKHFGLFCASFTSSSAVFIGIPLCDALLGPKSIPYALLYYFANAAFFWTIGSYLIASDAHRQSRFSGKRALKAVFSPPLLGFLTGLATALLSLEPPAFLMNATAIIGQLTTPLALLYIGFTLSLVPSSRYLSRDLLVAAAGRLLVCPLITALVVLCLGLDDFVSRVFILQAALPAVMQASILSAHYRTDPEFGTLIITMTTIGCVVTVPLIMSFF